MNIHLELPPVITDPKSWVGVDIEIFTTKGDKEHLHRPTTGKFACAQFAIDDENVYVVTEEDQVAEALRRIQPATWVLHGGKFDFTHLRRWADVPPRKKYWDTMYIERILFSGYYTHFSLDACTRRYLQRYLEKDTRDEFTERTTLSREQIEYAALDALVTREIAGHQRRIMTPTLYDVWSKIDRRAVWSFLDFKGFAIDVEGWTALAEEHRRKQQEIASALPLNPNSPQQVMEFLKRNKIKAKDTTADELEKAREKTNDENVRSIISDIILSRHYGKLASTYGLKFVEDFLEKDGDNYVIQGNYDPNRAETGRTACSDPNMQNIPVRESPVFREKFIARVGHKLIILDFKSQEPFNTAIISGEPRLIDWINQGKDIYIEFGKEVLDRNITKDSPERDQMKTLVLGGNYGMTEYGTAKKLNISVDDARVLIAKAKKVLPVLYRYMEDQREAKNVVYTLSGRPIHLNHYSSQAERNALNAPIQGTAGDQMKVAMADVHDDWSEFSFVDAPIVAYVHDELVLDEEEHKAKDAAMFAKEKMEKAATDMVNGVIQFKVDVKIGDSWAAKHG